MIKLREARERIRRVPVTLLIVAVSLCVCSTAAARASAQEVVLALSAEPEVGVALSGRPSPSAPEVPALEMDGRAPDLGPAAEPPARPATEGDSPVGTPDASRRVPESTSAVLRAPRTSDPDDETDLGSLGDVLPDPLCRDLILLQSRVQRARRVLFGRRGILRLGSVGPDDDSSRLRLNLQYSPDPGIRFTLVTG